MAALSGQSLDALLAELGSRISLADRPSPSRDPNVLALGWEELDALLPEGGLPRGVIELASKHTLGGSTLIALHAVRAAQTSGTRDNPDPSRAWCAWIDPEGTLYAPGVAGAGVSLERLFVVRPSRRDLPRIAVKVASSGAFDLVVIDMDPVPGIAHVPTKPRRGPRREIAPEVLVRKLALAAETRGVTILLLTDVTAPRAMPWPVAMRLELSRREGALSVRVAKDRRGKMSVAKTWITLG